MLIKMSLVKHLELEDNLSLVEDQKFACSPMPMNKNNIKFQTT